MRTRPVIGVEKVLLSFVGGFSGSTGGGIKCVPYFLVFFLSAAAFGFGDHDLVTPLTAAGATLGIIGPGLGEVGPAGNYDLIDNPLKLRCVFAMIAGRLEICSEPIVLTPALWRR